MNDQDLSLSFPNINGPECEEKEFLESKHKHLELLGNNIKIKNLGINMNFCKRFEDQIGIFQCPGTKI